LLNEVLAGDEIKHFREVSMARGLVALRRRKQIRLAVRIALAMVVPAAIAYSIIRLNPGPAVPSSISVASKSDQLEKTERVELINDDELLALFPDRGVALIGKPGSQKLMIFGKLPKEHAESRL